MASNPIELMCREIVELVTDYLGDSLPAPERIRFEQHLSTCPPCTAYLMQVRTTLELAAELGPAAPSPADSEIAETAQRLGDLFKRWHANRNE